MSECGSACVCAYVCVNGFRRAGAEGILVGIPGMVLETCGSVSVSPQSGMSLPFHLKMVRPGTWLRSAQLLTVVITSGVIGQLTTIGLSLSPR